jgi:hypothetical protein
MRYRLRTLLVALGILPPLLAGVWFACWFLYGAILSLRNAQMNDKILLVVLAYFVLQVVLLLVLPKWWKAAACPALLVLPIILFDLTNGGNLSGFITLWLTPYAIGWLLLILLLFGVMKLLRLTARVDS